MQLSHFLLQQKLALILPSSVVWDAAYQSAK